MRKALDMCFALDMRCAREGAISYRIAKQYIESAEGRYIELCEAKHIDKSKTYSSAPGHILEQDHRAGSGAFENQHRGAGL